MMTDASFRARCHRCGARFQWQGTLWDMPPCPGCGQTLPADQKRRAQRQLEAAAEQDALGRLSRAIAPNGARIANN